MDNCIFCKIANGEIPSQPVYEDDVCFAFNDIAPAAPTHILVIPKTHYKSILEIEDPELISRLFLAARKVAAQLGLDANGFRLVVNTGKEGGQTVDHMHIHILAGRNLSWPPG